MKNREIQELLIKFGILDPPADGAWGVQSKRALAYFQKLKGLTANGEIDDRTLQALSTTTELIPIKFGNDFASHIIRYMLDLGYFVSRGKGLYNIVYIEDVEDDWEPIPRENPNIFNDRGVVIEIGEDGVPRFLCNDLCTTEPGIPGTIGPKRHPQGAARIEFGQYKGWGWGYHRGKYRALRQVKPIVVCRDLNKDYSRAGDRRYRGNFGINQHHAGDSWRIGEYSYGCAARQSRKKHFRFMDIIEQDVRYLLGKEDYVFFSTFLPGDKLWSFVHQRSTVAA
ncbi:MAG: peptidoglycan-binding protein [Cyanosarcina radialis HA8281-LM2]|jgi:hypothetical protein|nr:peptidoglycan-binding protein [Cyanosarcina radialis HA8281-LM2]